MNKVTAFALAGGAIALGCLALVAQTKTSGDHGALARGRYLVHSAAMCIDCHSPRGEDGRFQEDRHLTGSLLPFVATVPMPWGSVAPNIAGLPAGYRPEDMTRFLMTGERPNGLPPTLPPMPSFRFDREDAEAISSYLASLKPNG